MRCQKDMEGKDFKQLEKKLDMYVNMLLYVPIFQGRYLIRHKYLDDAAASRFPPGQLGRLYQYDSKEGRYYKKVMSVPKLLLVNGELFHEHSESVFTDKDKEALEKHLGDDVHYIIVVQAKEQEETAYMIGKDKGLEVSTLNRRWIITKQPIEKSISKQNEVTAVLFCLLDYLVELELSDEKRRAFFERHPVKEEIGRKDAPYEPYVDKNSIKVYDMKNKPDTNDTIKELYYFSRKGGGKGAAYHKIGYEKVPHTRKGHYRRYKSGKTIYVKATIVHKEKYGGIQLAHRMNQADTKEVPSRGEEKEDALSLGMRM
ncbi:MAG: hypothetical protein LUK37_22515 [Clostridia bacterium]|nr:hypothetical protein [Clostridia bacterium]